MKTDETIVNIILCLFIYLLANKNVFREVSAYIRACLGVY